MHNCLFSWVSPCPDTGGGGQGWGTKPDEIFSPTKSQFQLLPSTEALPNPLLQVHIATCNQIHWIFLLLQRCGGGVDFDYVQTSPSCSSWDSCPLPTEGSYPFFHGFTIPHFCILPTGSQISNSNQVQPNEATLPVILLGTIAMPLPPAMVSFLHSLSKQTLKSPHFHLHFCSTSWSLTTRCVPFQLWWRSFIVLPPKSEIPPLT